MRTSSSLYNVNDSDWGERLVNLNMLVIHADVNV